MGSDMNAFAKAPVSAKKLLKPISACIVAAFGLAAPAAFAAVTHTVTSCADAGPGTLRDIINDTIGTVSGDTVDFSGLDTTLCSVISLTTGEILVTQEDLIIKGTPDIPIIGKYNNGRLFRHINSGDLQFSYVAMGIAKTENASGNAAGGCILSYGSVGLSHSVVLGCYANATGASHKAYGGAIAALGTVGLKYSQVSTSAATSELAASRGGGVIALNGVIAKYSSVFGNSANGSSGAGGGLYVQGPLTIENSTISGNSADFVAGGVWKSGTGEVLMTSSTISGNDAPNGFMGGMFITGSPSVTVTNSTIAFNTAKEYNFGGQFYASGLVISAGSVDVTAKIQGTIISDNSHGNYDFDFSQHPGTKTITFDAASAKNLFRVPNVGSIPEDTIVFECPYLGTLRDNGGLTQTHSLHSHSIAIDASDAAGFTYTSDQRADAVLYPRVSNLFADIGAYEVNQNDIVFTSQFEGCRPLIF